MPLFSQSIAFNRPVPRWPNWKGLRPTFHQSHNGPGGAESIGHNRPQRKRACSPFIPASPTLASHCWRPHVMAAQEMSTRLPVRPFVRYPPVVQERKSKGVSKGKTFSFSDSLPAPRVAPLSLSLPLFLFQGAFSNALWYLNWPLLHHFTHTHNRLCVFKWFRLNPISPLFLHVACFSPASSSCVGGWRDTVSRCQRCIAQEMDLIFKGPVPKGLRNVLWMCGYDIQRPIYRKRCSRCDEVLWLLFSFLSCLFVAFKCLKAANETYEVISRNWIKKIKYNIIKQGLTSIGC